MDAVTGGGNSESEEAPSHPSVGDLVSFSGREPTVQGSERRRGGGENCMNSGNSPLHGWYELFEEVVSNASPTFSDMGHYLLILKYPTTTFKFE